MDIIAQERLFMLLSQQNNMLIVLIVFTGAVLGANVFRQLRK